MLEALVNGDMVLVCCEVEDDVILARWVQFNPVAHPAILGTTQELYRPKQADALPITVRVPDEPLALVHTDVRFPIIAAPPSLDS